MTAFGSPCLVCSVCAKNDPKCALRCLAVGRLGDFICKNPDQKRALSPVAEEGFNKPHIWLGFLDMPKRCVYPGCKIEALRKRSFREAKLGLVDVFPMVSVKRGFMRVSWELLLTRGRGALALGSMRA